MVTHAAPTIAAVINEQQLTATHITPCSVCRVQHEVVSGLKYIQVVKRMGVKGKSNADCNGVYTSYNRYGQSS